MDNLTWSEVVKFFSGRTVLVTGHTGFKGAWLTSVLGIAGARVIGISLPGPGSLLFERYFGNIDLQDIRGDIRDFETVKNALAKYRPDVIFHLAAQALVKESYKSPLETFSTNVIGAANLLDALRGYPTLRSLVYITSDKCYENKEWVWGYREDDRLGGHDPYSASKACAEIVFDSFRQSYFSDQQSLGMASARAGNVIGGGDLSPDRIVPDIIRAIQTHQPVSIRNPSATRPWQHVLEPVSGYIKLSILLAEDPQFFSGSWNFGPPIASARSVAGLLSEFKHNFNSLKFETYNKPIDKEFENTLLQLNCDKAQLQMGWSCKLNVAETIRFTSDWYKVYLNDQNITEITQRQIHDYFEIG